VKQQHHHNHNQQQEQKQEEAEEEEEEAEEEEEEEEEEKEEEEEDIDGDVVRRRRRRKRKRRRKRACMKEKSCSVSSGETVVRYDAPSALFWFMHVRPTLDKASAPVIELIQKPGECSMPHMVSAACHTW
jgi:hypothetical protein